MTPDLLIALRALEQQWREEAHAIDHGWVVVTKPEIMQCAYQLAAVLTQYEQKTKTDDLLGNTASSDSTAECHADPSDDLTSEQIAELRADYERWVKNRPVTQMREYIESALFLLSQIEAHLKKCDHCWYPYSDAVGALRKAFGVDGGRSAEASSAVPSKPEESE